MRINLNFPGIEKSFNYFFDYNLRLGDKLTFYYSWGPVTYYVAEMSCDNKEVWLEKDV